MEERMENVISYRKATTEDIEFLADSRMSFIEADKNHKQYDEIRENIVQYFRETISGELCEVILAEKEGDVVGMGTIFYYKSIPSTQNPNGKNAYITSMYVNKDERKQGIAFSILDQLIACAKEKEYRVVMLNASEMGESLYEKYGFSYSKSGMVMYL